MAQKNNLHLSSFTQLAEEAWELFKKTWVAYLKIVGVSLAFIFLAVLVGVLIILPVSFLTVGSSFQQFNPPTPFTTVMFVLLIIWFILFILSLIALEFIFPIVGIYILQGKKSSPILHLVKQSKAILWPFLLTVLLGELLSIGGTILFVIPGLLIAFFFTFVIYEVVIEGKTGTLALQRSYFMVKNNFWEILGRLVLVELGIVIVSWVLGKFAGGDALLNLVQFLFSLFASWYARAYAFLLYKEVRAKTTFPEHISIQWIWVVSIVGWVVILILLNTLSLGFFQHPGMMGPGMMHSGYRDHMYRSMGSGSAG
jgi:hypothetical protein